jgi:hypothetical protein
MQAEEVCMLHVVVRSFYSYLHYTYGTLHNRIGQWLQSYNSLACISLRSHAKRTGE